MRLSRPALVLATAAATVFTTVAGVVGSTGAALADPGFEVLDNQAKQSLELSVLAGFVPFAESFWRASDIPEPNTGRYTAVGSGVTQPRGAGDIAFAYATLLTAEPQQQEFGGVSRATMLDHTVQSIRHEAYTNVLSGSGHGTWGGGTWQASLETYGWADAAHLLWDRLDPDTQAIVRKVLTGEADILITKPIADATPGNTGAEDNGWNSPTPALAAVMFPDDPHRADWEQAAIKLALNASSTAADATSDQHVDGRALSDWMASTNLNDDLTMENHGFFNPIYQQVTHTNIDDAAIFYAQGGHVQPEAFSFRTKEIWDRILGRLADGTGDLVMPAGQDWISKDYQHLDYLSVLATRFRAPDASVLESRALQTVARRQDTHSDGSILEQPQLGYESMLIKRLAGSWWNHELFGPSPTPTRAEFDAARAKTAGVTEFPSVEVISDRSNRASSFMSWNGARPMGLWVPSVDGHEDDPLFTYYAPQSLIGSASGAVSGYSCTCGTDRFSTAGVIGGRDFSMTSFPDGIALLLDRGSGSTFTYALEQIPGLTGDRTVYSAGGAGLGEVSGDWVNVAGRMAMIVRGGAGITVADVHGTNDTRLITGSAGTGSGNRGAMLVPAIDRSTTAGLASAVRQPDVPDGWSALVARAPDGTDRFAVGRWSGPATASLALTDDRGAPVPGEEAEIAGTTATVPVSLDAPASEGQTLRFFVKSNAALLARQDGENRAVLTNTGDGPVHTTTTYVAPDGTSSSVERVIAQGETTVARIVGGRLTLAGGEYEHLLDARATLTALRDSVSTWVREHRISAADHARLTAAGAVALAAIDRADDAAMATAPDTRREAAAVAVAAGAVAQLRVGSSAPADVRAAVAQARSSAGTALRQAADELTVHVVVQVVGRALPGEEAVVRVVAFNRGLAAASHGVLRFDLPQGWTLDTPDEAFRSLAPGDSAAAQFVATLAPTAATGPAELSTTLDYRALDRQLSATAQRSVMVVATYTLGGTPAPMGLAAGGWNQMQVAIHNNAAHELTLSLSADAPPGVTATPSHASLAVPAGGDVTEAIDLTNSVANTSGRGTVRVLASAGSGVTATSTQELVYSDNLAYNPAGSGYPRAFADSSQAGFPPSRADDGDASTFWVSDGTTAGSGPTPQHPIALGVDLGAPLTVGSVDLTPRTGYGPRSYQVQVSADGDSWSTVATVTDGPNAPRHTSFAAVTARHLRLLMTAGYDGTNRNVQVSELALHAA